MCISFCHVLLVLGADSSDSITEWHILSRLLRWHRGNLWLSQGNLWLPQCQCSNSGGYGYNKTVPNHNKTLQSANRLHSFWIYCVYRKMPIHMMTSSNGNIFCVTGPLCGEFTVHRWIPLTKASDAELWCFFICAWINGWVNHREAGDWRHHRAHYDVTVMDILCLPQNANSTQTNIILPGR